MVVGVVVVPIWSSSLAVIPNMIVSERTRERVSGEIVGGGRQGLKC